ncbi:major capsid protein [Golden Marseillevirus]|uniref:major capsid protein n=1 Tax=Golden Marseillevirus TaxID=1720526 RepID=UPI000877A8F4|nr:major capsid protein [Golden Marseillevirus]ALX27597.1 major capsid protein [Golden Marseillevirus]
MGSNMNSVVSGTRVTAASGFVDLATFSDLEAYLYGGCSAVTYFVRAIKKANWFSFLPVVLRNIAGLPGFGSEFSASVNRSGDYVLNTWLRVRVPLIAIRPTNGAGAINANATIRWTRNFMHNLVEKINITFNDLIVHEFDNYWLDFNAQANIDASKRIGYRNMIGDIPAMINPVTTGNPLGTGDFFNLPVPLFYSEDSGLALAVSALPFNDIKINYTLRRWQDLLVLNTGVGANPPTYDDVVQVSYDSTFTLIYSTSAPALTNVETWCHYAVVHNDERVKMGKNPRDMVIKQVQKVNETTINLSQLNALLPIDIRISHAVVAYFFAIQNSSDSRRVVQLHHRTPPMPVLTRSRLLSLCTSRLPVSATAPTTTALLSPGIGKSRSPKRLDTTRTLILSTVSPLIPRVRPIIPSSPTSRTNMFLLLLPSTPLLVSPTKVFRSRLLPILPSLSSCRLSGTSSGSLTSTFFACLAEAWVFRSYKWFFYFLVIQTFSHSSLRACNASKKYFMFLQT